MKRLRIERDALDDLETARNWYEANSEAAKVRFVEAVERAIFAANERPTSFPLLRRSTRRVLADPFPYAVLFVDGADATVVIAVFHTSRDSRYFARRSR